MTGPFGGWRRLAFRLRRHELEPRLDEEVRFHVEQQIEKNVRAGMAPEEARRQALVRFGGLERTRESVRDEFRFGALEDFVRDLRHGARSLRRAPGFTLVVSLTLALGVGATTAMFSVVNGVVLRPLPYPNQDRLVELLHEAPGVGVAELNSSPASYFGYREHSRVFEAVGHWDWDRSPATVTGGTRPEAVTSVAVSHEVLSILGAVPIRGRGFTEADDAPGGAPAVIVSHGYWQRRFGSADPVGQTLVVDGIPRQVIGVLPATFRFFDYPADLFYPLQLSRSDAAFPSGDGRGLARVKPGITLADANADVARMVPILDAEFPGGDAEAMRFAPKLRWLKDRVVGSLGPTLWLLLGTSAILLLIACANVSNLVLVRTQSRRPELAVRTALGAGWTAVARVVVAESILLGVAGGLAGIAVAYLSLPFLLALGASDLPGIMSVTIDPVVLGVALAATMTATLLFSLIPVVHFGMPRLHVARELGGGTRAITESRDGNRTRHGLLVAQVALALVLLVGSGLMMRSFVSLRQVDAGFGNAATVQTMQLAIPAALVPAAGEPGAHDVARTMRLQHDIVERLAAVPGVTAAGFSSSNDGLPLDGDGRSGNIQVEGSTRGDGAPTLREFQAVSPAFFDVLETPIVAGRAFDWNDVHDRRPVVMVSANLARAEWGSVEAALGQRVRANGRGPRLEVVGVAGDVRHDGLDRPAPETVIFPAFARNTMASFVVRSARVGTSGFLDELQRAVWSANPNLSLSQVVTLDQMLRRSMARTTMTLQLLLIIGLLALALGLIGTYGIVSYAVSQRRREIGIRLALGARHAEVRRMFVGHALRLVALGVIVGLVCAAGLTRLMTSQLFGVSPLDPVTHLGVALALAASAGLAGYASARRASALDPLTVLRGE